MNRPTRSKLCERRREVANLALKGWTQAAIARHMHLPQATVSRDLAAMREFWREFPVYDFDRARLEQLQKIDLVEAEAWAAWQRSQEPQRSAWWRNTNRIPINSIQSRSLSAVGRKCISGFARGGEAEM